MNNLLYHIDISLEQEFILWLNIQVQMD